MRVRALSFNAGRRLPTTGIHRHELLHARGSLERERDAADIILLYWY